MKLIGLFLVFSFFFSCDNKNVKNKCLRISEDTLFDENIDNSDFLKNLNSFDQLVLDEGVILGNYWFISISSFLENHDIASNEHEFTLLIDSLFQHLDYGVLNVSTVGTPSGNYLDTTLHYIRTPLFCSISYISKDKKKVDVSWQNKKIDDFYLIEKNENNISSSLKNGDVKIVSKTEFYHCFYNGIEYRKSLYTEYEFVKGENNVRVLFLGAIPKIKHM